jgi:hypothetical protein
MVTNATIRPRASAPLQRASKEGATIPVIRLLVVVVIWVCVVVLAAVTKEVSVEAVAKDAVDSPTTVTVTDTMLSVVKTPV